jgi:phage-related protein
VPGEDEEVRIRASMDDDMSAAMDRIRHRIEDTSDAVDELGAKAEASGRAGGRGMDQFGDKVEGAGNKARRAKKPIGDAGDEAVKSGVKAATASKGFDELGKKFEKAGKKGGGLSTIFKVFKLTGLVTGAFALAGGLSALGAGGAIAVGGLAPVVGVVAGALPIFAAAKLSMLLFKLAADQLDPTLTRIKNQFTELGPVIAKGGLQQGLDYFANSLGKLSKVTGRGLAGLGGEIGSAAHNAGDLAKSAPFLDQVSRIFAGLRPILKFILSGLLAIAQAAMNVLEAALPAAEGMGAAFEWIATSLRNWTAQQLANGKMTQFITHAWELFIQIVGVVVDFVIGLYNIFKVAAGYSAGFGQSIHDLAWEFRQWTASAEGQARITKYFEDSLPALREMGKLVGFVAGGLGHLGANPNVAPLLAQINSQLLPALANLVTKLSGAGGLGPTLIDVATQLATLFAGLDFSGLGAFVMAIDGLLHALVWLQQNVPGANFLISSLLFTMLGFKLLGPVFDTIGKGIVAFGWMKAALTATEGLSAGQKVFAGVIKPLGGLFTKLGGVVMNVVVPALRMIAIAGVGALRTLSTALFTTPVGWIILAIIAVIAAIVLLWTKCAWFREAVMAVWEAIKTAAIATWNALKTAFFAVVDALVAAWNFVRDSAMAVWNALKTAWQATVDFIVMVAMWIWDHGLKQVFSVIVTAFKIYFNVMKFIVQTAIYIIVGIITLIAIAAKAVFDLIVFVVKWAIGIVVSVFQWGIGILTTVWNWLWANAIKPVIDLFVAAWNNTVTTLTQAWNLLTGIIAAGWNWLWTTIIKPVIDFFVGAWNVAVNGISTAASWLWTGIQTSISIFWGWVSPIFSAIGNAGAAVWRFISDTASSIWDGITGVWNRVVGFLGGIFDKLKSAGTGVWDAIKSAASTVGDVISGVWNSIKGAVAGVWNFLARGWNSIPDITVPDWVPLIGGKTFGLPKLPMLWKGGEVPGGGSAIVGEHGPEPLVVNGRYSGMVGAGGPEVASIPKGGYVVPNLDTLRALPGLAKTIPSGVARAVASRVPGYAAHGGGGDSGAAGLATAVRRLAQVVDERPPPIVANSADVAREVEEKLRRLQAEKELRRKYHYGDN